MHYHIVNAACLKEYYIYLKFEDGMEGVVDLKQVVGKGEMFAPLKDTDFFCRMRLASHARTVEWPNGADLSPEQLYETIKHAPDRVAVYHFDS